MKRLLLTFLLLCGSAWGTTRYVAQSAGTFSGGSACNGHTAITPATWNSTSESAGNITYLCGTISSSTAGQNLLTFGWSGTSGSPIQLIFDTGASLQNSQYWGTNPFSGAAGAIVVSGKNYITINGQTPTAGQIENTLNGSSGATCPGGSCSNLTGSNGSNGIYASGAGIVIENLYVGPGYTHLQDDGGGANVVGIFTDNCQSCMITGNTVVGDYQNIFMGYSGTLNVTSVTISNNVLDHSCKEIQIGDDNTNSTSSGWLIYGNTLGPHNTEWTQTSQACHNDGLFINAVATGSLISSSAIYNNVITTDMCNDSAGSDSNMNCTGPLYLAGAYNGIDIFNNVVAIAPSTPYSGYEGLFVARPVNSGTGPLQNIKVLNNTFVGNNSTTLQGANCNFLKIGNETGYDNSGWIVKNNIIENLNATGGCAGAALYYNDVVDTSTFFSLFGAAANVNNNDYYNFVKMGVDGGDSQTYTTFTNWQTSGSGSFPGYDANGSSGNPLLTNYIPQTGSAAIGLGANLTSSATGLMAALSSDAAGNARPSSGAWTAGAYNAAGGSTVATPTFSPGAGTYSSSQSVTISSSTSGATLCYTTDGSTPTANGAGTCTHGTTYSTAVTVAVNETLKAVGSLSGDSDSSVGSAAYVLQGSAPTFSPAAGTYSSNQSVTISQSQSLAMCYTLNGSTPASTGTGSCATGSTSYSSPITVSVTETVKAIGYANGWTDSSVGSAAYTITGTPNPPSGLNVTLSNVGSAIGSTYYLSPAGNDSNNGTSPSAPWLTPNHAVNCGDVIIAAASTAYSYLNFQTWGTVTCAAGNNVAWLTCVTFDACKISFSASLRTGMQIGTSYWGVSGWEIDGTSATGDCFYATPSTTANLTHIIFANDIANGCGLSGFGTDVSAGNYGSDYITFIGNASYGNAGGTVNCSSGFSIWEPIASDTAPGTHIYVAGNFAWANYNGLCNSGVPQDGDGIIFDTFDGDQTGTPIPYRGQALADNNILVGNGGRGFVTVGNWEGTAPYSNVYIRHNTIWGNNTDTRQNASYCGDLLLSYVRQTEAYDNLVQSTSATGCGSNTLYAFFVGYGFSTDLIYNNFGIGVSGQNLGTENNQSFTAGPNNTFSSPSFANPVTPGAPSCGSASSVPNCMATMIANFTPTATAAASYGYQAPSTTPVYDPLFPQWLCTVNLPANLVTIGCTPKLGVLNWTASSTGGVTYDVYRGTAPGVCSNGSGPYASGISAVTYTDTAAIPGVNYFYEVGALSGSTHSSCAGPAELVVPPTYPVWSGL